MKILRRDEFLAMPAGTIFARAEADGDGRIIRSFGELFQKGDTWDNGPDVMGTFLYASLCDVDCNDPSDMDRILEGMLRDGNSVPVAQVYQRDGMFEPMDVFLVYEAEDIIRVADCLGNALRAIAGQPLFELRHTDDAAGS